MLAVLTTLLQYTYTEPTALQLLMAVADAACLIIHVSCAQHCIREHPEHIALLRWTLLLRVTCE